MSRRNSEIDWDLLEALRWKHFEWKNTVNQHVLGDVYVPGEGDNPRVMLIGEAPGAQEEIEGRPFVGPAGQILRQLMGFAELYTEKQGPIGSRTAQPNCWLTNVVKFRPPRNRNPFPSEIGACRWWLHHEWIAIDCPRIIVAVGGIALSAIRGRQQGILNQSGRCYGFTSNHNGRQMWLWPMIHPSYGLRNKGTGIQELIEADWEKLATWLSRERR